jgi:hypothetical protein
MRQVACLEELAALTSEMLSAAEVRDEEAISRLGERYYVLSDEIVDLPLASADDPAADRIRELSELIVKRQCEIEAAVAPWMDDMKIIFREQRNERALAAAYRQAE